MMNTLNYNKNKMFKLKKTHPKDSLINFCIVGENNIGKTSMMTFMAKSNLFNYKNLKVPPDFTNRYLVFND